MIMELSIEEKAKAYDEAKARIKAAWDSNRCTLGFMNEIFPEFKENEDERLRKTTICFLKDFAKQGYENAIECIDWLEKHAPTPQGKSALEAIKEEKVDNANKVETKDYSSIDPHFFKTTNIKPKFKVGQWIVGANNVVRIISLNDELNCYIAVTPNNEEVKIPYHFDDGQGHACSYHLWTIADAKDGDVLVHSSFMFNDFIFIYNNTSLLQAYYYYYKEINKIVIEDRSHHCPWNMQEVTPATKEERELLFQKIKEADYEWDADNKRLIKV